MILGFQNNTRGLEDKVTYCPIFVTRAGTLDLVHVSRWFIWSPLREPPSLSGNSTGLGTEKIHFLVTHSPTTAAIPAIGNIPTHTTRAAITPTDIPAAGYGRKRASEIARGLAICCQGRTGAVGAAIGAPPLKIGQ